MTIELRRRIERIIGTLEDTQEQIEEVRREVRERYDNLSDEEKDSDDADLLVEKEEALDEQYVALYDIIGGLWEVLNG